MIDQTIPTSEANFPRLPAPADFDLATIALSQASAILDVLAVLVEETKTHIPDTDQDALVQSLYAAKSEVERAKAALSGAEDRVS